MWFAGGKVILDFYNNDSLKEKRRRVGDLIKDVHKQFNVSATEVDDHDDPERATIGIALAAGTEPGARAALQKILEYIDTHSFARVELEDTDVFAYD